MADISRAEVASLIQDEFASEVITTAEATSAVIEAFPTVPMGTKVRNMPVLAGTPVAKWVGESATDPGGVKPTSEAIWGNKQLVAEEIAVIIPVHENVLDDATVAVLSELAREGGKAIGFGLDAAVLFGTAKPASWTSLDLHAAAVAAGQIFQVGATGTVNDLGGSILQAAGVVADAGYDPSDLFARKGLRYQLANLRNTDGTPIFIGSLSDTPGDNGAVQGLSAHWITGQAHDGGAPGAAVPVWDPTVLALVVDDSRVRIGIRQDVTVKFLDQATVGGINLAERDMVALRFKARFAYVLADGLTNDGADKTPVAAVTPTPAGP
ncbi:phage major capsid protein [soil metagenome]